MRLPGDFGGESGKKKLTESGGLEVLEVPGIKEQVVFSLPRELVFE